MTGDGSRAPGGHPSPAGTADAPDVAAQKEICVDIQQQFWQDLPYIPLGQRFGPVAVNTRVTDVPRGFPLFYGLKTS